jgi:hypothetical protein
LKRFAIATSIQDKALRIGEPRDEDSWNELCKLFEAAVPDKSKVEAKWLSALLHSLQVNNELVHFKNQRLKDAATAK